MPNYIAKSCTEILNGQRYYFLYTSSGFRVYHWEPEVSSLAPISSNFFINLKDARAHALENSLPEHEKDRLKLHIAYLQGNREPSRLARR